MKWFGLLCLYPFKEESDEKKNAKKKTDPSNFLMSTQFIWCSSEFLWAGRNLPFAIYQ